MPRHGGLVDERQLTGPPRAAYGVTPLGQCDAAWRSQIRRILGGSYLVGLFFVSASFYAGEKKPTRSVIRPSMPSASSRSAFAGSLTV